MHLSSHRTKVEEVCARQPASRQPTSACDRDDPLRDGCPLRGAAFLDEELPAVTDLFHTFAFGDDPTLDLEGLRALLAAVGERPDEATLRQLFTTADVDSSGGIDLQEFLAAVRPASNPQATPRYHSPEPRPNHCTRALPRTQVDAFLGTAPARCVLLVGGPGSGKGLLCSRLVATCGVAHMSTGNMLREEVEAGTPLGHSVAEIMQAGKLVPSATITTLSTLLARAARARDGRGRAAAARRLCPPPHDRVGRDWVRWDGARWDVRLLRAFAPPSPTPSGAVRRRMRSFPGQRLLLDGFPRSQQNAVDFEAQCGKPELALTLTCSEETMVQRILKRARLEGRPDDNLVTAHKRIETFREQGAPTLAWLRGSGVPIIEIDANGTPDDVWGQLLAVGRLMRGAVELPSRSPG